MRLQSDPYLRADQPLPMLVRQLDAVLRQIITQVNLLSEGHVQAATNAATAPPTAGEYVQGDYIRNSTPTASGSPEVVVLGWVCTVSGTPGTWHEVQALTGN